jgi:hypothetical protein
MAGTAFKDVGGETAPSQVVIVVYIKEDYRHNRQSPHLKLSSTVDLPRAHGSLKDGVLPRLFKKKKSLTLFK